MKVCFNYEGIISLFHTLKQFCVLLVPLFFLFCKNFKHFWADSIGVARETTISG